MVDNNTNGGLQPYNIYWLYYDVEKPRNWTVMYHLFETS